MSSSERGGFSRGVAPQHGSGTGSTSPWQVISRDIEADIQSVFSTFTVSAIQQVQISRNDLRVDDIRLSDARTTRVYTLLPSAPGGIISVRQVNTMSCEDKTDPDGQGARLSWSDGLWWITRCCAVPALLFVSPVALSFVLEAPSESRDWILLVSFAAMAVGLVVGLWRCLIGGSAVVLGGVGAMSTDLWEFGFLTPHMAMLIPVILVGLAYCWVALFRWCEQRQG